MPLPTSAEHALTAGLPPFAASRRPIPDRADSGSRGLLRWFLEHGGSRGLLRRFLERFAGCWLPTAQPVTLHEMPFTVGMEATPRRRDWLGKRVGSPIESRSPFVISGTASHMVHASTFRGASPCAKVHHLHRPVQLALLH
jgi:hypothetical protein